MNIVQRHANENAPYIASNYKKHWTVLEENELISESLASSKLSIQQIAKKHKRTIGGIESRLKIIERRDRVSENNPKKHWTTLEDEQLKREVASFAPCMPTKPLCNPKFQPLSEIALQQIASKHGRSCGAIECRLRIVMSNQSKPLLYLSNVGKRWSLNEEAQLAKELISQMAVQQMALNHKRTCGGIECRLRLISSNQKTNRQIGTKSTNTTQQDQFTGTNENAPITLNAVYDAIQQVLSQMSTKLPVATSHSSHIDANDVCTGIVYDETSQHAHDIGVNVLHARRKNSASRKSAKLTKLLSKS